ncbi:MAG: tRNA nucleotidyltransferase, partial [Bacteroidota bacterium]
MQVKAALELPVFQKLRACTQKTGLRAYAIGGYVRDYFLQRPSKDIDVVVEGKGIEFAEAFAAEIGGKATVYPNFGTAMVPYKDWVVEFVGA